MYAIAFDLDSDTLQLLYKNPSYNNAYYDIKTPLKGMDLQDNKVVFTLEKKEW